MKHFRNLAMQRKLETGNAIDVSKCQREGPYYVLTPDIWRGPDAEVDYCDAAQDKWIWSIGRRRSDGVILASCSTNFYQNPDFECLWLR